ncbi:Histone-lysine N-methyltransferase PR-Set7 [Pseudolycoriella hygida]|uniref:Histone-lysine N-methyltransferase PR-Set7 n=1 Tax=Pseudolycoriella hygida TaxID=35572 RepID=A0A9Q0RWP9_9DIPT|nr:Histone-lysine N-methyltransferase PR-Set7 [Pseudolycoriella hygida]
MITTRNRFLYRLNVNQADNFTNNCNESDRTFGARKSRIKATKKITDSRAKNTKMTDFYPVRRSGRRTKSELEREYLSSIETGIRTGQKTGVMKEIFPGKGRGLVTTKPFRKNEFVIEYIGELITAAVAKERVEKYTVEQAGCFLFYFKHSGHNYCIDATKESDELGRLLNHSRNGNLKPKTFVYRNRPHIVLLAKQDIQIGEELSYDYGDREKTAMLNNPWLKT